MPSSRNGGNIKFGIDFEANQASLNKLKKSLQDLQKIKFGEGFDGNRQEFNEVKARITEIQNLMKTAFNPTLNTSNITAFKNELEKSGMSLKQIQSDFSRFGTTGNTAFNQLTTSVLTTNLKLKETNSLIDAMGKTMVNTVKWGIASSVMNTFTQSVQGAFQYVQSLEKSLTNIRIVTGDSTEKMAQFAEQANRSAQALGRSTLDYTKASLTFYQQGLNDQDVQARTEATLKAQNITGAGQQMADYLTSVWNGYKVANEEAELYVDKLAAVADSSASDMSQLAIAMSKVASTASTMGVDIDQLNAQIATVVATTRQAPESVGTAFKTIYTRMNDIKTGSDEAEISLGRYSGKMAELGFNVLDATGHLRDTGQVMEEIGGRWQDLTREQQIYLAQTMGGQRQVNQLMALFDNWTTYSDLLNTSLESEGTLAEKNARYMESLGAKMEQLGAAGERVKDALIDSDSMKGVIDALTSVTNLTANLFETMGSGQTILLAFGSTMTQLFSGTIAKEINSVITNMQNMKTNAETIRNQLEMTKMVQQVGKDTPGGTVVADRLADIQKYYSVMDEASINNQKNLIAERGQLQNQIQTIKEAQDKVIELTNAFEQGQVTKEDFVDANNFEPLNTAIGETQGKLQDVKDLFSKNLFENWNRIENIQDAQKLVEAVKAFQVEYEKIDPTKAKQLLNDLDKLNSGQMSGQTFGQKLQEYLAAADVQAKELSNTINNSAQALSNAQGKADSLDRALKQNVDSAKQLFDVTNAVKMISAIGQISSSLMTIRNLKTIWDDKDVSIGEKLAKTFTSLGFLAPSLYSSYKSIANAMGITQALSERRLVIEKAITKEKEKQQLLEKKARLQQQIKNLNINGGLTPEKAKELNTEYKAISQSLNKVSSEALSAQAAAASLSGKFSTAFGAAAVSVSGFVTAIAPILPILAGIGAVVGVGYLIYEDFNKAKKASEQAAKAAQDAKKNYDELKESFKNLTSSISDYKDAKTALNELTTGTEEWRDAVNDLNDKVLQLIENFPELANYLERTEDGILSINQEGFDEVTNKARQKTYAAGISRANLEESAFNAEKESKITDEGRRIYGEYNGKDTLNKAIDVLQNGNFSGENGLEKALRDTNNFSEAEIAATVQNSEAIYQLINSLDAEQARVDTLKDTYLRTALQNEDIYKNTLNKDALADIVSSIFDQNTKELNEKYYKDPDTKWTLDRNALFDRYEEITGKDVKETGLINKKIEADGEQISLESIASLVASTDSLQHISQNLESAATRLSDAQLAFKDADQRTKQLLFNSGLAGGFDKVNTDSLSQVDVNKLKGLNQNDLADFLGIDVEKIPSKLKELGASVQEGLDSFINGIEEGNTRAVMLQLKDKYGADLSKELAEIIAQNVQDGYQKVGTESGNAIRDFYKKLSGDQVDDIAKLAEEYNYAGNSVEDFIKAVRETGVTSEKVSDDMVKAFYDAQSKIQDIQTKEYKTDLDKVNQANSTGSLGTQLNAGQKLSDKELVSYKEGLQEILKIYPELDKQVSILNNTQLAGTREYESALRDVKLALMSSYLAMGEMGKITSQDFTNQMMTLVTDTEMFQNLYQTGALNNEQFSTILQNLAVQYESCKDELAKYNAQLRTGTEETKNAAAFNLMLATRSAENADKYGIQAQQISALANHYVELARSGNQAYQGMDQSSELAVDAATRYIRLNEAVQTLQKDYTKVNETLSALQNYDFGEVLGDADYAKTFVEIKKAVEDIIGIEEGLLDDNFIKQHAQEIKEAANGSEQAIASLQEAAAEEIWVNVNLNDEKFREATQMSKQEFADWINNLPEGELSLDDTQMLETLANSLLEAGYTVTDLQNMFEGAHLNIDMEADPSNVIEAANQAIAAVDSTAYDAQSVSSSQTQTDQQETGGYELIPHDQQGHFETPLFRESVTPFGVIPEYGGMQSHPFTYTEFTSKPDKQTQDISNVNTVTGVKIKHANKAPVGGQVSHKNKNGGNKKNTGGGKGRKGGGGGGKAKQLNRAKGETRTPDRYRNNTVKANNLANSMEKLQKQQERLGGKGTLNNLKKQLQILEQQNKNIKERIGLQRDEQAELANNLKKYGATFKNGTLDNYFKVHAKIMDEYNKKLAKWNSASADWQEKNKDFLNNAKEVMDKALKDLERYDKLQQEIAENIQKSKDNAQEQINTKLKQFEIKVEASLDLANAKRDWNKFRQDILDEVRDDDILGLNKYRFADLSSYFNDAQTGSIQQLGKRLKTLVGDGSLNMDIFSANYSYQDLKNKIQHMTLTDRKSWLEEIGKVSKDLEGQMEGFKEKVDEIKESIFDTIDAVQDAFDEQMDEYEYLGDLINHNMKIAEMMYGDQAYDQMAKYYDKIEQNNNKQLEFLRQQKDLWYSRMHEEQARMARIASQQGTDSNAYKESRDRFKEYEKHWMDSVKNLNSMIEDSLDNIIDKYANAINDIFLKFELNLGNGKTFDDIGDEWDMINDKADMFLDKINSAYQIEKLQNAFEDAIGDNEGDIAAQQALNNLMEQQLAYLKDKDKLTQYDVDRANTLLQIEIKRLALQQARSNKNKLRLRRDSQGNYTYQYTADTEAMNKAEQDLADARISLYNSDKAAYVDNLSAIQKSANDIKDKLEDIWTDENLSKEEKLQKSYELEKYYGEKINDLLAENASIRNNLIDSSFEDLARIYNMSVEDLKALPQDQQDAIFKNLIPQADSAVAQMVQTLAGAGGFSGFFDNLLTPLTQAFDDRIASMAEVQEQAQQNLGDITSDYDTLIGQTERLLDNNQQLVKSQEQQLTQVQNQLLYVEDILKTYQDIKDTIAEILKLSYQVQEQDALGVLGVSQKADQKATDKQAASLQEYTSRQTSTSDLGSDYTPYEPNWHSNNFMAGLKSSNVDESSVLTKQNENLLNNTQTQNNYNRFNDYTTKWVDSIAAINNNVFDSINSTLNNILTTNQEYYAKSLSQQEAIEKAIIANQTVHIDADFPNARDVNHIIEAIQSLTALAAQKAGSTTTSAKGGKAHGSKKK